MNLSKYDIAVVLSVVFLFASVAIPTIYGNSLNFAAPSYDDPNNSPRKDMNFTYSLTCNDDGSANFYFFARNAAKIDGFADNTLVRLILYEPYDGEKTKGTTNITGEVNLNISRAGKYQLDLYNELYKKPDYAYFDFSPCPVKNLPPLVKENKTVTDGEKNETPVKNETIFVPPPEENKSEVIPPSDNTTMVPVQNNTGNQTVIPPDEIPKTMPEPVKDGNGVFDSASILLLIAGFGFVVLVVAVAFYFIMKKGSGFAKSSSEPGYKFKSKKKPGGIPRMGSIN